MRIVAFIVLALGFHIAPAVAGESGDLGPPTVKRMVIPANPPNTPRPPKAVAVAVVVNHMVTVKKKDGHTTPGIVAHHACQQPQEFGPDLENLPDDYDDVIVTDPLTGEQHHEQVLRRKWIRVTVRCGASTYIQRRCVFGDCPPAEDARLDVLPDVQFLIGLAIDTADFEIPEPLFSPEVRPGKVPVPGLPFYFAVPQEQWDRIVVAHAVACNGIRCAYAHVSAKVIGVEFDPGDGTSPITCASAGVSIRSAEQFRTASKACSHVYQKSARFSGSLSMMYRVTAFGGETGQPPSVGPTDSRLDVTQLVDIPVTEYQPVIIK